MTLKAFLASAAILSSGLVLAPLSFATAAAAATTLDWTFAPSSSGGLAGSGQLTVDAIGDVTAFSGSVGGNALSFYANPNFPGTSTLHGVPNTGGADYIYDDYVNPNPGVDDLTQNGVLVSAGSGSSQVFYDLSLDNPSGPPADLFSITPKGSYVYDDGTFTTSAAVSSAVPEPSVWAMMLAGVCMIGAALRFNRRRGTALSLI